MKPAEVIQKNYLRNFLVVLLLVFLFGIVTSALVFFMNIHRPLDTHYSAILSIMSDLKDTLIVKSLKISALFSFLTIIGLLLLGILYTHRIAGPLHRIKLAAKSIGSGQLSTRINLRNKDVVHPFAESINTMTNTYNEKVKELTIKIGELKASITELKSQAREKKETGTALRKVSDINNNIQGLIDDIRL